MLPHRRAVLLAAALALLAVAQAQVQPSTAASGPALPWAEVTNHAAFDGRTTSSGVVLKGTAVVAGGQGQNGLLEDVWQSDSAGGSWKMLTNTAGWGKRMGHSMVTVGNVVWLTGGYAGLLETKNDVWTTTDLSHWVQVVQRASWTPRQGHMTVLWHDRVWLMGGSRGSTYNNELWTSVDGSTWTQGPSAGWSPRTEARAAVYGNALFVAGGRGAGSAAVLNDQTVQDSHGYLNDVWSTTDGSTWQVAVRPAKWAPRALFGMVVHSGFLWVIGGVFKPDSTTAITLGDVWKSNNMGEHWEVVSGDAIFANRSSFGAVELGEQLLVFGGLEALTGSEVSLKYRADVWSSTDTLMCEYGGLVCAKHGSCSDQVCHCWSGWAGDDCLVPVCDKTACLHGHCVNGTAPNLQQVLGTPVSGPCASASPPAQFERTSQSAVEEYYRLYSRRLNLQCQMDLPPQRIVEQLTAQPSHCACEALWDGPNCTSAVCLAGCNHGTCVDEPNSCHCEAGYFGQFCGQSNKLHAVGQWVTDRAMQLYVGVAGFWFLAVVISSLHANHCARGPRAVKAAVAAARSTSRRVRFAD